ncbi:hypothetical protein YC2023_065980 [Brassica napus]
MSLLTLANELEWKDGGLRTPQDSMERSLDKSSHGQEVFLTCRIWPLVDGKRDPPDLLGAGAAEDFLDVFWMGFGLTSGSVADLMAASRVCLCVSVSTHRTSVAVHQYTYHHAGPWTQHAGPSRGLGRPCVSISTHRTSVAVRVCPCVSLSTHRMSVAVHQYTYLHVGPWTQHADPSRGLFGTHRTSVGVRQHTEDVRVCPSAYTGRPWLSVCVSVCLSAHTGRPWLSISTHISTLVLGLSTLTLPVDCSGDFGPCGLSVQYTQEVCGCPSAHTGRPCVSVSTHRTSVAVCVCPCVSVSTHKMSVAVHQYTYLHVGPWTQHADPSRGLFG